MGTQNLNGQMSEGKSCWGLWKCNGNSFRLGKPLACKSLETGRTLETLPHNRAPFARSLSVQTLSYPSVTTHLGWLTWLNVAPGTRVLRSHSQPKVGEFSGSLF